MPPPHTASERLGRFLARSRRAAITGLGAFLACFVTTWTVFLTWACFANPQYLGPVRMLILLALVGATVTGVAVCGCVWWFSVAWHRWLLVVVTELIPRRHDTDIPQPAAPSNKRPHLVDAGR